MKTKPQPLDLQEIDKLRDAKLEEFSKKLLEEGGSLEIGKQYVVFPASDDFVVLIGNIIKEPLEKFKQRLKSACEFYLRYKDRPDLLRKEQKFNYEKKGIQTLDKYNTWLFKLAFKDVFKEGECVKQKLI